MVDFLNKTLPTSDKAERFIEGDHICTVEVVKLREKDPQNPKSTDDLYIIDFTCESSTNEGMVPGATYGLMKGASNAYGTKLMQELLAAAEGNPVALPRYSGKETVTVEKYTKARGNWTEEKVLPAAQVRIMQLVGDDETLEQCGLERIDITGAKVLVKTRGTLAVDRKTGEPILDKETGEQVIYWNSTIERLPAGKGGDPLFPGDSE